MVQFFDVRVTLKILNLYASTKNGYIFAVSAFCVCFLRLASAFKKTHTLSPPPKIVDVNLHIYNSLFLISAKIAYLPKT